MFKLLFLLCFYSGGKSKMLKLLGFTRSRVLALSMLPRRLLWSKKLGNTGETLEMWHKPYFKQKFYMLEMVSIDKEIYTPQVVSRKT
jgi:hypothetical protein